MDVILRKDVEDLGRRGERVKVAPGYARTFLLPKKLAIAATESNKKIVEVERQAHQHKETKALGEAEDLRKMLKGVTLTISQKVSENNQLFGTVTAMDIAKALEAQSFHIDRRKVQLEEPIKKLGEFNVPVRLHRDVTVEVQLRVIAEVPRAESSGHVRQSPEEQLRSEALRVFGDREAAEEWLNEPIPSLGGHKPIDMLRGSTADRDRVFTVLGRIEYGLF